MVYGDNEDELGGDLVSCCDYNVKSDDSFSICGFRACKIVDDGGGSDDNGDENGYYYGCAINSNGAGGTIGGCWTDDYGDGDDDDGGKVNTISAGNSDCNDGGGGNRGGGCNRGGGGSDGNSAGKINCSGVGIIGGHDYYGGCDADSCLLVKKEGNAGGKSDACNSSGYGDHSSCNCIGEKNKKSSGDQISVHEKRKRNNQACKKFRKARKTRQQQLHVIVEVLQKENFTLNNKINQLETEIKKWKEFFEKHPKYAQQKGLLKL